MLKTNLELILLGILLASSFVQSHKTVKEDVDQDEIDEAISQTSRAYTAGVEKPQIQTYKVDTYKLMAKFDHDEEWQQRGTIEASKDSTGKIIDVEVSNNDISTKSNAVEQLFEQACIHDKLYQLSVPEFDIMTSVPACQYMKSGFNETLAFHADANGNLNGLSYEVIDYEYLASLEKNPKKKRLLTTKQFEKFMTRAQLPPLFEGTRPIFTKVKYNSLGGEVQEKASTEEQPEEERSFLSKYWLYILMAFMVLPNLLGAAPEEAAAPQGAPAAGAARK